MRTSLRLGGGAGFAGDRLDAPARSRRARRARLPGARVPRRAHDRARAAAATARSCERLRRAADRAHRVAAADSRSGAGIKLVSNFGAANPLAAADAIVAIARRLRIPVKVAAVTGDDVLDALDLDAPTMEGGVPLSQYAPIVSANAYLGAEALLPALASGADIVVTGRVADPSLFVAPLMHEYGWAPDDVDRLARGTAVGHLLECAGQLCGGYFADPGRKEIPDMAHLGFPFADVDADGNADARQGRGHRRTHHARDRDRAASVRSHRSARLSHAGRHRRLLRRSR